MKSYSQYAGLAFAMACSVCVSDSASAQVFSGNSENGIPVIKTQENGTVSSNEAPRDDDKGRDPHKDSPALVLMPSHGKYPGNDSPSMVLTPSRGNYPQQESPSIPFTGRYQNSCLGEILILENPNEIFVYVNGRTARAKDADELMRMYPDAYRLYDQTLGKDKRLFLARYAEWKQRFWDSGRFQDAGGGLPGGQFDINSPQNHNISVLEKGKQVSITGNTTKMTVTVNGKPVRSNNIAQLKKKFPDAFNMFEKHLAQ